MTQLHLFNFGKKDRTEDQQSASPDEAIVMPRARARARSSDDADEGTRRRRPVKVGATSWYGPAVDRVNAYEAAKLNGGRIGASRVRGYRDKVAIEEVTWEKNQIIALETARREVPSGAFLYWDQIAERVPGKTATQCEDYVRTQLFNRAAGTNKNFFKEQIFVKEPEMKVRRRRRSSSSSAARESSSSDAGAAAAPFGFFAGLFGR
ncbi:unnamed protein product [Vitrella brassicaformis CCMP3155]|uniref:Myb-like domain-containing protein n=1 Tax=Vitrella brassicaformis (strain CCMP3155) TaxID=1169540 RepID=A0A0G4FCV5_VITBC|nr:unnamed protein product [Vitrella brassicaformis CCMP3155]|eukprot:CEM10753.1 unnamed protein product [Vitrella brassicaformis CCMP3155]